MQYSFFFQFFPLGRLTFSSLPSRNCFPSPISCWKSTPHSSKKERISPYKNTPFTNGARVRDLAREGNSSREYGQKRRRVLIIKNVLKIESSNIVSGHFQETILRQVSKDRSLIVKTGSYVGDSTCNDYTSVLGAGQEVISTSLYSTWMLGFVGF